MDRERALVRGLLRELFGYKPPADVLERETDIDTVMLWVTEIRRRYWPDPDRPMPVVVPPALAPRLIAGGLVEGRDFEINRPLPEA